MNKISIEMLEQKIAEGEEIIDDYFDANSTRIGKTYATIERRNKEKFIQQNLELPESMVKEINLIATELNITTDAVIKMMLKRCLDEHSLAKNNL